MKKCSSCGATYNDSTNFCSSCGTRLTAVSAQRSRHPGHKKKQHRLIGRLAVPAVVLILVLSTVFIFFYRKEYKPLIVDHNPSVYTYEDLVSDTDLLKSRYSSPSVKRALQNSGALLDPDSVLLSGGYLSGTRSDDEGRAESLSLPGSADSACQR